MCADAAKPAPERFGYSDAVTGLVRIGKEEGIRVFGRGLSANVVRSVLMSESLSYARMGFAVCLHVTPRRFSNRAVSETLYRIPTRVRVRPVLTSPARPDMPPPNEQFSYGPISKTIFGRTRSLRCSLERWPRPRAPPPMC